MQNNNIQPSQRLGIVTSVIFITVVLSIFGGFTIEIGYLMSNNKLFLAFISMLVVYTIYKLVSKFKQSTEHDFIVMNSKISKEH